MAWVEIEASGLDFAFTPTDAGITMAGSVVSCTDVTSPSFNIELNAVPEPVPVFRVTVQSYTAGSPFGLVGGAYFGLNSPSGLASFDNEEPSANPQTAFTPSQFSADCTSLAYGAAAGSEFNSVESFAFLIEVEAETPPSSCDCEWMPYSNYHEFRVQVQHLMEGDDTKQGTFSTKTVDLLIRLGEQRIYRDLRASTMVEHFDLLPVANAIMLPDCLLELKELWADGRTPIELVPTDRFRTMSYDRYGPPSLPRYDGSALPVFAAQDGELLRFFPQAIGNVQGSYYGKPCPLATGVWAEQKTFARYPELFIFAALAEAAPMIGEDARIPIWDGKYREALMNARQDERVRTYAGSPLRMRAR